VKKRTTVLALALIAIIAISLAGCGQAKKTEVKSGLSANEIISRSNKKMEAVKSYRAQGTYKMSAPAISSTPSQGNEKMEFSFEMKMKMNTPTDFEGQMVTKGLGTETTVYMKNGYAYANVPGKGWVKAPVTDFSKSQTATPEQISEYTKWAKDMKVSSEDSKGWNIDFEIRPEFFQEQLKKALGTSVPTGESSAPSNGYAQIIQELAKSTTMNMSLRILKNTFYLENARMLMSMKNVPQLGDMEMDISISLSDFNSPVTVTIPAEAQSAKEVTPEEIPGLSGETFPGL